MLKSMLSLRKIPFGRFRRDRSGNFAALTALAALPIMFTIGGAVDLNLFHTSRTKIQNAADAAALAAAKRFPFDPNETRLKQLAQDYFDANVGSLYRTRSTLHYEGTRLNENNIRELTIGVEFAYDPVFLPLMGNLTGLDGTNRLESVVAIGNTTVEMAMVLDTSGSMDRVPASGGETKIRALRTIASDAIDQLFNASELAGVEDPVRVSVVPFSGAVNLGVDANSWWLDPKGLHPRHHEHLDWAKFNYTTLPDGYGEGSPDWGLRRYRDNQIAIRDPRSTLPATQRPWVRADEQRTYLTRQYVMAKAGTNSAPMLNVGGLKGANAPCRPPRGFDENFAPFCTWSLDRGAWVFNGTAGGRGFSCRQDNSATSHCHPPYLIEESGPFFTSMLQAKRVCAEARNGAYALDSTPPSEQKPETLFLPYFAPDEYDQTYSTNLTNYYLSDKGYPASGRIAANSGWSHPLGGYPLYRTNADRDQILAAQRDVRRYLMKPTRLATAGDNNRFTPFYLCDSDPLVPLSSSRADAKKAVVNLKATGATNVEEGLGWGWRTLTAEEPFAGGRERGLEENFKAIIVMTDGANTYYPDGNTLNLSSYGAYGFLREERIYENTTLNSSQRSSANLTRAMNERTAKLCENVKNDGRVPVKTARGDTVTDSTGRPVTRDGVLVYTIAFDVQDREVHELLQNCASATIGDQMAGRDPSNSSKYFYNAKSNAELKTAFNDIVASLSSLRIAR